MYVFIALVQRLKKSFYLGELDVKEEYTPAPGPDYPFLILDVREPDLYARSHLALAHSYPAIK
jgi:hypothetical protein